MDLDLVTAIGIGCAVVTIVAAQDIEGAADAIGGVICFILGITDEESE